MRMQRHSLFTVALSLAISAVPWALRAADAPKADEAKTARESAEEGVWQQLRSGAAGFRKIRCLFASHARPEEGAGCIRTFGVQGLA